MSENFETDSFKKVARISDEELAELWKTYLADKNNKTVRDKLIVQYIYLTRYVIGRIKVNLPPSFSYEDIASYGVEGLIDAVENYAIVKTKLRSQGIMIDEFDLMIAATALSKSYILVTDNVKHFQRIAGLKLENWIKR